MKIDLKPVRAGIKAVITGYKSECLEKVKKLDRFDEYNLYGNPKGYQSLVRVADVIKILEEE